MNGRIQALAGYANQYSIDQQNYLERIHNRKLSSDEYKEIYNEKFAQLIVKECAKVANDNFDKGFCPVGEFITEHFGVE